jgi:hypothetical protein
MHTVRKETHGYRNRCFHVTNKCNDERSGWGTEQMVSRWTDASRLCRAVGPQRNKQRTPISDARRATLSWRAGGTTAHCSLQSATVSRAVRLQVKAIRGWEGWKPTESTRKMLAQSVQWPCYRLDNRSSIPTGTGNFPLRQRVQTGSGAHPASYPVGAGGNTAGGVKLTTRLHLTPRLRMCGAIPPLPHTSPWHGDNFTCTLCAATRWYPKFSDCLPGARTGNGTALCH